MKTTSARSLRIAVGTMLLGLGGCTPSSNDGAKVTPKNDASRVGKEIETVDEGPIDPPPKTPEAKPEPTPEPTPKTSDDGGCQPPDCHINPGPNDDPKDKPIPLPEPKAVPEPKRVNTGPVPSKPEP